MRIARKTPVGLWTAILAVVVLLGLIGGVATIAGMASSLKPAPASYPVPKVGELNSDPAKMGDVTLKGCTLMTGGGWIATGEVSNPAKAKAKYQITVYFLKGDLPVNYATSSVAVPGGETRPWAAPRQFNLAGDPTLTCKIAAVS